jgi:opacity protein-like surface antigen
MKRILVAAVAAVILGATVTACSTVDTASDQVALHYNGGLGASQYFKDCVDSSQNQWNSPGDTYYYYPKGQRTYSFSTDNKSDFGPLKASSSDSVEMTIQGIVALTLDTSCKAITDSTGHKWDGGLLQRFHEQLANNEQAAPTDSGQPMQSGWSDLLNKYIKQALESAVKTETSKYKWEDLYNNTNNVQALWSDAVIKQVAPTIKTIMGDNYFHLDGIIMQRPDIPDGLKGPLTDKQAASVNAQAVEVAKNAANSFPGGIAAYQSYLQQQAVNKAIQDGKVQVIPVPQGSGINIQLPSK